jgi:putative two-component system response regulator
MPESKSNTCADSLREAVLASAPQSSVNKSIKSYLSEVPGREDSFEFKPLLDLTAVDGFAAISHEALLLALYDQQMAWKEQVRAHAQELKDTQFQIIRRLARAAEYKDNETGMHVIRMSHYSHLLGEKAGLGPAQCEVLLHAAPMHDVGKIGIPDHILLKPGKLDADEWQVMMTHTTIGAEIIGDHDSDLLKMAKTVAITHHEKWNGTGYPNGLSGEDIPLVGRIVAIADVFDALTNERPYKEAWPVERAVTLLKEESGHHFDPHLVSQFLEIMPQIEQIKAQYVDIAV